MKGGSHIMRGHSQREVVTHIMRDCHSRHVSHKERFSVIKRGCHVNRRSFTLREVGTRIKRGCLSH